MKNEKILHLTELGLLTALLILFSFTPLGYLKIGLVEITFNMIPVLIGSIVIGPAAGAILGAIFGATSFIQCFGTSAFGALILGINPFFTVLICFVPRILAGLLPGLIFRSLSHIGKTKLLAYGIASASGSAINTVLFVGGFSLLFRNTMLGMASEKGLSPLMFIATVFLINAAIELAVCTVIVTAIPKTVDHVTKSKRAEYK